MPGHIVALGGGGFSMEPDNPVLDDFILSLSRRMIARDGTSGYAVDDGAALHFVGTRLREVVSSRPTARAYRVAVKRGKVVETPLATRLLGKPATGRR